MNTAAYKAYSHNNIQVESPEKLVEMMYEGILRFCTLAKKAIQEENIETKVYWLNRTTAIFAELIRTLNHKEGGNVAYYLEGLYTQQIKFLGNANIDNDTQPVDTVIHVTRELLELWREQHTLQLD